MGRPGIEMSGWSLGAKKGPIQYGGEQKMPGSER